MDTRTQEKIEAIIRDRKRAHGFYTDKSDVYRKFLPMEGAAFSKDGMGKAAKELIAVGISVTIHCESCLEWHIREAIGAGASIDDVLDAVGVGMEMGGGPATVSARFAMSVIEYYAQHARIKQIGEDADLEPWADLIRDSFAAVAKEFGLTPSNCPFHPAFLEAEKLYKMREDGACFLGLYMAGRLIGLAAVNIRDKQCHIEKLCVSPGFRHWGFGTRMMEEAMAYAREQGCQKASIGIIDENKILKDWYSGMGFRVDEIKGFDHLPFTVCMMERDL